MLKTPIAPPPVPADASSPAPLAGDQLAKHDTVLAHFVPTDGAEYTLDGTPLNDEERFWLSDECIQRYLRASKWAERTAITRLEATLRWRRDYGFYDGQMAPDQVSIENETGKQIIFGFDAARHPCLYLLPSRQNTDTPPRQIRATVFMLERVLDLCGPGVESLALLINFADRAKNPSIQTARTVLNILQEHYPERLGAAYIIKVPFLVNLFFKAVLPFVDPKTRTKLHFNPTLPDPALISGASLLKADGWPGDVDFAYEHAAYWPALVRLCAERREREVEFWRAHQGAKIGAGEWERKLAAQDVELGEGEGGETIEAETLVAAALIPESVVETVEVNGAAEKEMEEKEDEGTGGGKESAEEGQGSRVSENPPTLPPL
ncbi:CRAL/TRIO domain-containing protein [Auricularia subglabra TFB-10046 SS5]|nr:CRAL/TRIO domain-containing protein [Auricularia subglabra TFB-10046 SS5]